MNKQRRKKLNEIMEQIDQLMDDLEEVQNEEQESLDNLPEQFQEGERGEIMQNAIDNLDSAWSSLEEAKDTLEEIINN